MANLRLGIVGTENSHADHILAEVNNNRRYGDVRVVAVHGPDDQRNGELRNLFGISHVVGEVTDMVDLVDAVVVMDRHGDDHLAHARPFLEAGRTVYVDKPLACSTGDAQQIIGLADKHGAPLMSCSTLRYAPAVENAAEALPGIGDVRAIQVVGPGDADSPYGGIFFYGIHCADVALRFADGPVADVSARRRGGTTAVTATAGEVEVSLVLIGGGADVNVPFHLTMVGTTGVISQPIPIGPHYVRGSLDTFMRTAATGVQPVSATDLGRPIDLLEQVDAQISNRPDRLAPRSVSPSEGAFRR